MFPRLTWTTSYWEPSLRKSGRRQVGAKTAYKVLQKTWRSFSCDKARAVLGSYILPNTQELSDRRQTQAFGPSRLVGRLQREVGMSNDPPATQAFGTSALAQRQVSSDVSDVFTSTVHKASMFDPESFDETTSAPPATQTFGPSKLGGLHRSSAGSFNSLEPSKLVRLPHSLRITNKTDNVQIRPLPYADLVSSKRPSLSVVLRPGTPRPTSA